MTTYATNETAIRALTTRILAGEEASSTGKDTYLANLVATTQKELGAKERVNMPRGRAARLDEEGIGAQLGALMAVHEKFYAAVLDACKERLKDAKEVNRASNFARTALYAVRSFIKAGKDITTVAAGRVTKSVLAVPRPPKPPSVKRLHTRAVRESKSLIATLLQLAELDRDAAAAEVETLVGVLGSDLANLGAKITHAKGATTLFMPTATQTARGASARAQ